MGLGRESAERLPGQKIFKEEGSTSSSSYVLSDRKGLEDFRAPRPLMEALGSFELRFEENMGWLGFLWKFESKRKSFAQHAPVAPPPEALAGPGVSCTRSWSSSLTAALVPSTRSRPEPGGSGRRLRRVANQCPTHQTSLVYNSAASPTSRSPRCHVCSLRYFLRCNAVKRGSAFNS